MWNRSHIIQRMDIFIETEKWTRFVDKEAFCTEVQRSNLVKGQPCSDVYWLAQSILILHGNITIAMTLKSSYGRSLRHKQYCTVFLTKVAQLLLKKDLTKFNKVSIYGYVCQNLVEIKVLKLSAYP